MNKSGPASEIVPNSRELENTTFVKTIMMFVIILYHCFVVCKGDGFVDSNQVLIPASFSYIIDFFSSFQNYTFVLASGYIFAYVKYERNSYQTFKGFVKNKFFRLLLPFIAISLIWGIPWKITLFDLSLKQVFVQWILAVNPDQLWFLLMLFEVSVVFWIMDNILELQILSVKTILIFIVLYFIGSYCASKFINVFRLFGMLQMLLFFYIGYCLRRNCTNRWMIKRLCPLMFLILFPTCEILSTYTDTTVVIVYKVLQLCMKVTGCMAVFTLLQSLADVLKWKERKLFMFFSKMSMPIYLFHQQIIYFFVFILFDKFNAYFCVFLSFVFSVIISTIISTIFKKTSITRLMIGEKKIGN